mgnify:CR=1 FL=1
MNQGGELPGTLRQGKLLAYVQISGKEKQGQTEEKGGLLCSQQKGERGKG